MSDLDLGTIIVNSDLIAYVVPPETKDVRTAIYFTDFPLDDDKKVRMVEEDYELIKKLLKAIPVTKTPVKLH